MRLLLIKAIVFTVPVVKSGPVATNDRARNIIAKRLGKSAPQSSIFHCVYKQKLEIWKTCPSGSSKNHWVSLTELKSGIFPYLVGIPDATFAYKTNRFLLFGGSKVVQSLQMIAPGTELQKDAKKVPRNHQYFIAFISKSWEFGKRAHRNDQKALGFT